MSTEARVSNLNNLCDTCQRIPFETLRYPKISEIPSIKSGHPPKGKFPYKHDADKRMSMVNLGYLSHIRDKQHCQLCRIIWREFRKLNVYSESGHSALGHEVTCKADIGTHLGLFRYPEKDSSSHITLYRLSISTHIPPNHNIDDYPHMWLDHCFQTCDVGTEQIIAEDLVHINKGFDRYIFGGRRRPLQIDLNRIRQWLNICENQHGNVCSKTLDQSGVFQ